MEEDNPHDLLESLAFSFKQVRHIKQRRDGRREKESSFAAGCFIKGIRAMTGLGLLPVPADLCKKRKVVPQEFIAFCPGYRCRQWRTTHKARQTFEGAVMGAGGLVGWGDEG